MSQDIINNRFWEESVFAIADGYCVINLTKSIVRGGVGEGVEDVGRAVDDVVSGGSNETQNPQENGATTQNGAGMAQ